ncbi:MAG: hypothetical protein RLY14_1404 [Planctomycetota bacterium]|jgi:conjugative transfer pilus assembly protein TraH
MKMRSTLVAAALSIPQLCSAGLLGDMNSMFLSNATSATSIKTKDRVGIMGGAYAMRAPIKSVTIIAYDAPRLDAGCGGIDLYGGSFSFINSQQLVQIFRQVAANAAGLAFKAAIKAISPSLDSLMGEFQSLMQNMNNLSKNSCQMSHMVIDPAEKAIANAVNGSGNVGAVQKGMFSDSIGSLTGYLADANSYFKKQGEVNPKTGNSVVKAVIASGASNILGLAGLSNFDGSTDDDSNPNSLNNKLLISFLGYEVNGVPCSTSNQSGQADSAPVTASNNLGRISCKGPNTLTLDSIVRGGGTGSTRPTVPLVLYKCMNPNGSGVPNGGIDPQICTQMQKEDFNYAGIEGWVNTMLFGSPTSGTVDSSSIVGKINGQQKLSFTTQQVQFMKVSGLPLIPLLTKTSNPEARVQMARKLGASLTNCIAAGFGEALYKAAGSIEYGNSHQISADAIRNKENLRNDYMVKQNACVEDYTVLKLAQQLTASATLNGNVK